MTTFFSYLTQHKLPTKATLRTLLTPPLTWYGVVLYTLIIGIIVVAYIALAQLNSNFLVTVPTKGGTLTEGVIGAPSFINPALASTETDLGLTQLLYSGLFRKSDDGVVVDLAKDYSISPDGRTYTITLKDNLLWSDKKPLTTGDVAFTIATLASPRSTTSSYWQGVATERVSDTSIRFILPEPRSDFLSALTVGIMPSHVWTSGDIGTNPANLHPVGSGPYMVHTLTYTGDVPSSIELVTNPHYSGTHPYISTYKQIFFANQTELLRGIESGSIDMTFSATPATAAAVTSSNMTIQKVASPYTIALFHHTGESILANAKLVQVLNNAIDKNLILDTVESGYGILPSTPTNTLDTSPADVIQELQSLGYTSRDGFLEKNGAPVGFAIAVENDPLSLRAAQTLAHELSAFGMIVPVKGFDHGTFQDRLRAGEFQVFLASEHDTNIPSSYEPVLTLYKKVYPFITTTPLRIPETLTSPLQRYQYLSEWAVRHDRIWSFIYNSMNK